jgi:hypothetical protein
MTTFSRFTIVLFLISIVITNLQAGDKINIRLHQPPPNQLGVKDLWKLDITNTTRENVNIYLTGTVSESMKGLIVSGKSKVLSVGPGTKTYTYDDFKSGEVNWKDRSIQEIILRTGNVPEGDYTICASAFYENNEIADQESCIEQSIKQMGSVTLISPGDGSELDMKQPVLFNWTPIVPKPSGTVTYRLKVWQLMQGQNGTQAMRSNQPIFSKDLDNITQTTITSIITGPCKPPYLCDFIWNVQAIVNESGFGENNGLSEPFEFSINFKGDNTPYVLFPDELPYVIDSKLNSKIHGREISQSITLHKYDKDLKTDDKIYLLEPSWAGATSKDQKAYEKLNTNKIDSYFGILESPEGELYAMPILVLFDPDPAVRIAEACSKCPTTYDNKRGCSMGGSFCFCLLSSDSIAKPKPINFTVGNGGSGTEVIKVFYPALLDNMGEVIVAFECLIPSNQVTFAELQQKGYRKMISCCSTTDRRCCHILETSGRTND